MKKLSHYALRITLCALLFCAASTICFAQSDGAMRLAILPMSKDADVSADLTLEKTKIATGKLYEGMENCGDFEILEREKVYALVQEMELASTGLIDPSTAPTFGKMLGAEYILISNVTGLSSRRKTSSIAGMGSNNYIVTARLAARIVHVETGRVVLAATSSATSADKVPKGFLGGTMQIGTESVSQWLVDDALEKAADALVDKMMMNLERKKAAMQ